MSHPARSVEITTHGKIVPYALVEDATHAFYYGKKRLADLGVTLETSLRDMRADTAAADAFAPKTSIRPKRSLEGCANHLISAPHHGANLCRPKDGSIKKENRRYLFRSQTGYSNAAVRQIVNQAANRCVLVNGNQSIFVHVFTGFTSALDKASHLRVPCHSVLSAKQVYILNTNSGAFSVSLINEMVRVIFGRGVWRSVVIWRTSINAIEQTRTTSLARIVNFLLPGESCDVDMTYEGSIHRARVSLQQCCRLGATVDRGERHVVAFIGVSLEPRPYSFISAPNHLTELSSIKAHWVQNELAGHFARIEHDQVSPEVRSLVDDAAFEGMLVDRDEGERTFTSCFSIRKRRRHSEAPSDRNMNQSSVCNLMGKSLTNHQKYQLSCEHFPIGDMFFLCVNTATWAVYALYAASTTGSERQAVIQTIPHSVAKLTMAGYSQTLTCSGSALRKGPGRQGYYRQPRIAGALLLVPVLLFLGFRARPVARSLGCLPYRAVIGVARGYSRSALVRLGVLLTFPPRLVVGRLGQVLIRSAQVGHASLSGWAGNARGEGTVRMGLWEYASGTDRAWAKEAV